MPMPVPRRSQAYMPLSNSTPASPLNVILYMAPMRDSDSAGGHASAQVAPRGKPAHGGVSVTPRRRQGSIIQDLSLYTYMKRNLCNYVYTLKRSRDIL